MAWAPLPRQRPQGAVKSGSQWNYLAPNAPNPFLVSHSRALPFRSAQFYKALGGGSIRKGNLLSFLNPFSSVWSRNSEAVKAGVKGNFIGEGTNLGGQYVVAKGGAVTFEFLEHQFGEHAAQADVLEVGTESFNGMLHFDLCIHPLDLLILRLLPSTSLMPTFHRERGAQRRSPS